MTERVIHMLDDAISKTTGCQFGFKCLDKGSRYPVCDVVGANGDNVLFVHNDTDSNCPYRGMSGKGDVCACPTHYSLHNQHPCMNSTLIVGREEHPEPWHNAKGNAPMPKTVAEAVQILVDELSLKDKLAIANMNAEEIGESALHLTNYIRDLFGLGSDNQALLLSCSKDTGCEIEHPDDASAIILARLVIELVKNHKLRSVQKLTEVSIP